MLLIKNGRVLTMANKTIEKGDVLIGDGKILKVGENIEAECETIDASGMWVVPGFIEAHCHLGMDEPYAGAAGNDANERTDPVTPFLNALDGVNLYDETFESALRAGITTVCTGPGSANVVGGTFSIIKTAGDSPIERIVEEKAAMKAALGENPKRVYGEMKRMPTTRMGSAYLMRNLLIKTMDYIQKKKRTFEKNEAFEEDLKYEEMIPVIEGEMPLKIHVHRADDILTAIRIKDEFNIKITLDHCTDGLLLIDEILKRDIPVIIGPTMTFRRKVETKGKTFDTVVEFIKRGAIAAVTTDHPVTCIEYLPICAALAAKAGLTDEEALKTITINPAKILGVDDKLGSIEEGKVSDISIFDDNPLSIMSRTKMVLINGKIMYREGI